MTYKITKELTREEMEIITSALTNYEIYCDNVIETLKETEEDDSLGTIEFWDERCQACKKLWFEFQPPF